MPALDRPYCVHQLIEDLRRDDIESYSIKTDQQIWAVYPLNHYGTFEGALTFSDGRDTENVDAGVVICSVEPREGISYILTPNPRSVMAAALELLVPYWREKAQFSPHAERSPNRGEFTAIGHAGFGWVKDNDRWVRFPHVGGVKIASTATIGANCSIPRGALSDTIIGHDTHLDDQVHIGHGSKVGNHVIIAANAMLSGSVIVEDDVWIGPSASIMQGVRIGAGATIGIGAVVLRDVAPGETVVGHHRVIATREKQLGVTR